MLVWLALWGIGIRTPWATFEVQRNGLVINAADDAEDAPGKDEALTGSSSTTTAPD